MFRDAVISPDGLYRYLLIRRWNSTKPTMTFVMLNPSMADANKDSMTIKRCMTIAKSHDQGGIRVVNLYAYRSPKPSILWRIEDPVGKLNIVYLTLALQKAQGPVVVAWGSYARMPEISRFKKLAADLDTPLWCLGKTKTGAPHHPLANMADVKLELWS